jgi:arginyl-tRNA synthetase
MLEKAILAIQKEFGVDFVIPEISLEYPMDEQFGDWTTNVAMVLGKNMKKNPIEVADQIVKLLNGYIVKDSFNKVETVKPGHINFYLAPKYFQDRVAEINEKENAFGSATGKKEKIMIEYSQPNTHKEFHIGHLRNVLIGSAMVNLSRKAGYPTVAANYFGDTGSHIAKCLWGLEKFHQGEDIDAIPDKAEFLGRAYSEAVQAIEKNPEYEQEFKDLQQRFDKGDEGLVALWKKTKQWSLDEFFAIYKILGVEFDALFYESEEEIAGKKILPELLNRGIVKESQGAIIADFEKDNLGVLVLQRKDGSALYGLKDIPLAIEKFEKYGVDTSITITDIRQSLYFKQLFKILELYGFQKKMRHFGFDFVSLKGGESMSSRKGNVIPARKLFAEVIRRVQEKFPASPSTEEIALGAIKFYMLKYSNGSVIEFDIDEALKLEGATGPYVQYAHARICSILEKAQSSKLETRSVKLDFLVHEKELSLIRELDKFPGLVAELAESYEVHRLAHYALKIADKFHSFYAECRVIDEADPELSAARLSLANAVRIVLAETLRLIGVSAPSKM